MRLKQWFAVWLAALVVVLGLMTHPRASMAGFNDDVEFVQPPGGESGDPDDGGPSRLLTTAWHSSVSSLSRWLSSVRASINKQCDVRRAHTSARSARTGNRRR